MKQDQTTLRAFNKMNIMRILLRNECAYCAEISRMTGLSIPTVMKITDEFIKEGLIAEVGRGTSSGGKPPKMLQLIPNAHFFIGVDARGPEYRCAIMNLRGELMIRHHMDSGHLTRNVSNIKDRMTDLLITLIAQTIERSGLDRSRIVGIGIGVPYPVDSQRGVIISLRDFDLVNFDITTPITSYFSMPVFLENTSKTIGLAEKYFGEAMDEENFSVISIGHGIGSAIFVGEEIYSGSNHMSGELGHMVIDINGPKCRCGNRGCLEAMASVSALHADVRERLRAGAKSELAELSTITTADICGLAKRGDALAREALNRMTDLLSIGIANLVNLMDINLTLLTGGIIEIYPELCVQTEEKVNRHRGQYLGGNKISVKPLQIGPDAAMIGAATLLLRETLNSGGKIH